MATSILIEKAAVANIASTYAARMLAQAKLAAKKELVSMSTAIDAAAARGSYRLSYRLSGSITRLTDANLEAAMEIIEDEIEAANYTAATEVKNSKGVVVGYDFNWGAPDPEPVEETTGEETGENTGETTEEATTEEETTEEATTEEEQPEYIYNAVTAEQIAAYEQNSQTPADAGLYEEGETEGTYVLSEDTTFDAEKTYYIKALNPVT